ncbi:outer membrane protein assembly factor BamE [Marinicella rhabdoformis]|uniref:outer membrane protein assembly factor BamE n=1 Tax=Marinicella rhabdoformis TaxID=2580566 RepID=UPI0012AEC508|nr:outer membrane protein assembly factor BamE [Marinicella rhabdoformis]
MKIALTTLFLALMTLTACYKTPVQQGNILKQEDIDEVKPGMSKRQVAIILGTPTVADPFNHDRWDYVNTSKVKGQFKKLKKFTVYFENDKLVKTEGNYFPKENNVEIEEPED